MSSDIPHPVSLTSISTISSKSLAVITMNPFLVNLIALATRLMRTYFSLF